MAEPITCTSTGPVGPRAPAATAAAYSHSVSLRGAAIRVPGRVLLYWPLRAPDPSRPAELQAASWWARRSRRVLRLLLRSLPAQQTGGGGGVQPPQPDRGAQ